MNGRPGNVFNVLICLYLIPFTQITIVNVKKLFHLTFMSWRPRKKVFC